MLVKLWSKTGNSKWVDSTYDHVLDVGRTVMHPKRTRSVRPRGTPLLAVDNLDKEVTILLYSLRNKHIDLSQRVYVLYERIDTYMFRVLGSLLILILLGAFSVLAL
jgi:hypothetical protein